MSFWKRLFGRSTSSPNETTWERIKREATEEGHRRRRALEQSPRATPDEMAARIANMRSKDQLTKAYNEMRHADFCDVVTAAVRGGNFSDQDATHALYIREWISTGGAWKTTFPEWLAQEGSQHIMKLNNQWLISGEKHTPFNDWLVGTRNSDQRASTASQTQKREKRGAQSESSVGGGKWHFEGDYLVCDYELTGLPPPQTNSSLKITCAVSRYLNGTVDTYLDFDLTPYLYLMPDEEPFEAHFVKPPFLVGLVADGSGAGNEAAPLVQGGMFEVHASGNEETHPNTAFLRIISSEDTARAVRTLALGKNVTFTLVDYDSEPPVRLRLRLPSDRGFAELYAQLHRSV